MRKRIYRLFEFDAEPLSLAWIARWFLIALIIANIAAVVLQSDREIEAQYRQFFYWFEWVSVAIFSIEYIARIWTSVELEKFKHLGPVRARVRYFFTPLAIFDLLAIAPAFLSAFLAIDLRLLRVVRLLRLFKLGHYSPSLELYWKVLRDQTRPLLGALMVMCVLILGSASLLFVAERSAQPEAFGSVAQSIWWAIVTLTTVGYGDVYPITLLGKLCAGFVMLLGVATVAVPAGILAGKFGDELQAQRKFVERSAEEAAADGRIDAAEREKLMNSGLANGVSRRTIEEILDIYTEQNQKLKQCPHCGKSLD